MVKDYYVQIMLISEYIEYCTFKVIKHPCQVQYVKEIAIRRWDAEIDFQKVCYRNDNDTIEEINDNNIFVKGAKYIIIYIPKACLTTKYMTTKK